jgi:ribA/ribD-fused uncharacterized protein
MAVRVGEEYKDQLRAFYKLRARKPRLTGYTERGDLQMFEQGKSKEDTPIAGDIIRLMEYRPITNEERESQDARRYEKIREAESTYEAGRARFRDLMEQYHLQRKGDVAAGGDIVTEEDIVNLSKEVHGYEMQLQEARFAMREAEPYESIPANQLEFENRYDVRMIPDVVAFVGRPFDVESTYVRLAKTGEEVGYKRTAKPKKETTASVILANTEPYDFLNPWSPSNVTYKGVLYPNAYTAIMVGIAEKLGDSVAVERIRAATTPEEATYTQDEKGVPEEEWNRAFGSILMRVTRQKFRENPLLAEKLLQTGKSRLVVIPLGDPLNTILGPGLQVDNPDIRNPKKWVGENLYGAALEYARSELMEERRRAPATVLPTATDAVTGTVFDVVSTTATAAKAVAPAAAAVASAAADMASGAASAVIAAFTPTTEVVRAKKRTLKIPKSGIEEGGAGGAGAAGAAGAAAATPFL